MQVDELANLEVEMSVLGSMLCSAEACDTVSAMLSEKDFYSPAHAAIYGAILGLIRNSVAIDLVTLRSHLRTLGKLDEVGTVDYLIQIADSVPSASNAEHYARIVQGLALRRRVLGLATKLKDLAVSDLTTEEITEKVSDAVVDATDVANAHAWKSAKELAWELEDEIDQLHTAGVSREGLLTGLGALDRIVGGLQPGQLIVVAARPSMGKTAIAVKVATGIALLGVPVGFFSMEMTAKQIAARCVASLAGVEVKMFRRNTVSEVTMEAISDGMDAFRPSALFVDDRSDQTPATIRAALRKLAREAKTVGLVIVDYLQLCSGQSRYERKDLEIAAITKGLKAIAKDLQVPVVVLSQLSREVEKREDKRPRMSDLRESGSIEQDADVVIGLFRPAYYDKSLADSYQWEEMEAIVLKQRDGATGTAKLGFYPSLMGFRDVAAKGDQG